MRTEPLGDILPVENDAPHHAARVASPAVGVNSPYLRSTRADSALAPVSPPPILMW